MSAADEVARFIQYLEVKKAVDDRSLNPRVWDSLAHGLAARGFPEPLRVLELGCGIGIMLERALERELFGPPAAPDETVARNETPGMSASGPSFPQIEYTGVDASPALIDAARRRLPAWAGRLGFEHAPATQADTLQCGAVAVHVRWEAADAFEFAARSGGYRLLLAHAFLDLVDARRALRAFLPLLRPGGLFYFSLVFDGVTHFQPALDPELDARIERLYHQTMDRRMIAGRPSGHSQTGRHLLGILPRAGGEILDAGSSDWVVFPSRGVYRPGEQQFLDFILETVGAALHDHPDLDPADLDAWLGQRRAQLGRRELGYIAHQLDFFGEYAPPA